MSLVKSSLRLSVVIVSWNTRDLLADCLESIHRYINQVENISCRTIVIDNNSKDGTSEMIGRHYPWVELILNNENQGFSRASNQGICSSNSPYILLLNSDTIIHANSVETLIEYIDSHTKVGAVGPCLLNGDGTLQISASPMMTPFREIWRLLFLDRIWHKASYSGASWHDKRPRPVDVLKGAALLLRRQALEDIGLLDEDYYMYSEEVDLCYRLNAAGWSTVYVPAAVVTHYGESSSRQVKDEMFLELYRSKVHFFRKTWGRSHSWLYKVILLIAYLPRAILRPRTRRMWRLLIDLPHM